jgi:GNAT superfamily N-acetyltransferase
MLLIRPAAVSDVPMLLKFFRELAEYERQSDAVVIKEEALIKDGFGSQPKFRSLIAEWEGQAIGYALFFGFYSSWKGSGIFLEDLFVQETFRGRGIRRALLSEVARIARQEGSLGFAGKSWVGMNRQSNSTSHWVASFSMNGDKSS